MIRWNVRPAMKAAGIANAYQLAKAAGLTYQICWRILQAEPIARLDVATLEKVAAALNVSDPLKLLSSK